MTSRSSIRKKRVFDEIQSYGEVVEFSCDRCFFAGIFCVMMESSKRMKCAECVKQGKPCVSLSWASLDQTRKKLRSEIDEDEEELAAVMARLMRKKKILRQADERAKRKLECLVSEMEAEGEIDVPQDCPAADATVGLSPAVWSSLDFINNSIGALDEVVAGGEGSGSFGGSGS